MINLRISIALAVLAALAAPMLVQAAPHMALPHDFPTNMTVLPGKRVFNMLGKKPLHLPPYEATAFRQGAVTFPQFEFVEAGVGPLAIRRTVAQTAQGYSFTLEESGHATWAAQCRLATSSSSTRLEGKTQSLERVGDIGRTLQCELQKQAR